MSRRTRKEHQIDRTWNALQAYLNGSIGLIAAFTQNEVNEIGNFLKFYHVIRTDEGQTRYKHNIKAFILSRGTIEDMGALADSKLTELPEYIETIYAKIFAMLPNIDWQTNACINMYLSFLSTEAMKKEFGSILTYVRFLRNAILVEDGVYSIACEREQVLIKKWLHMQQNFLVKWNIDIYYHADSNTQ